MLQSISSLNKPIMFSSSALIIVIILISWDGIRVISDMQTWKQTPFNAPYVINNIPLEKNGKLITYSIFENIPSQRPARESTDPHKNPIYAYFTWIGYLQGKYTMEDKTNAILEARSIIESNNIYSQYMLMKWTPILLEPNISNVTKIVVPVSTFSSINRLQIQAGLCSKFVCDSAFSSKNLIQPQLVPPANHTLQNQVMQTRYGINDISYKVALKEPKLMVENEIYFPGWRADLIFPDKKMQIPASVVNDVFRAWLLPAGDYIMIAHFDFPNLIVYQSISIISFGIWIFIIVRYWRRLGNDSRQSVKKENVAQ